MISCLLPVNNCVIVLFSRHKISICTMFGSLDDRFRHGRDRLEVHIRNPHRDPVKSLFYFHVLKWDLVHCDRIFSAPIHDRCKIIFHRLRLPFRIPSRFCADAFRILNILLFQNSLHKFFHLFLAFTTAFSRFGQLFHFFK